MSKRNLPPWAWEALTQAEALTALPEGTQKFDEVLHLGHALDVAIAALKAVIEIDNDNHYTSEPWYDTTAGEAAAQVAAQALAEIRGEDTGQ